MQRAPEGAVKNLNILIVDDDQSVLKLYCSLLKDAGHRLTPVETGRAAIEAVAAGSFDLIFLDLKLPDMSGAEVLKEIRPRIEWVPVVIVTANPTLDSSIDLINIGGVYEYIVKPFNREDLLIAIQRVMEKIKLTIENKRLINKLEIANSALTERVGQLEYCANMAAGSEKVLRELREKIRRLETRLTELGEDITKL